MNIKRAPRRTIASATSLLAVAALAIGSSTTASGSVAPASRADTPVAATSVVASVVGEAQLQSARPNIVFITTDDQGVDDMRWMPFTRRLIGARGINFTRALSPHPLCCPARAELVTGQYGQNNGVHHNGGTHGGYRSLVEPRNTLAKWLHDSGYQTGMVGKYLNGYGHDQAGPATKDPSWDQWNPSVDGEYSYNETTFFNNGNPTVETRMVDDVVNDYAQRYIREFSANDAPFYVWASNLAPHSRTGMTPPLPAGRHQGLFRGVVLPAASKASFNKPIVGGPRPSVLPTMAQMLRRQQKAFKVRIQALQAADEGVRDIVQTLTDTGELDNTYIIFTSDNGWLYGEHGFNSKNYLFEEALRIPMLVRIPGQTTATKSSVPVTLVDLASTVASLAGVTPARRQDGISFAPLLRGKTTMPWRVTQLVQTGRTSRTEADQGWALRGVRTARWTYVRNSADGKNELYDRARDPLQMVNLAKTRGYRPVVRELARRTVLLRTCAGWTCRRNFGPEPRPVMP